MEVEMKLDHAFFERFNAWKTGQGAVNQEAFEVLKTARELANGGKLMDEIFESKLSIDKAKAHLKSNGVAASETEPDKPAPNEEFRVREELEARTVPTDKKAEKKSSPLDVVLGRFKKGSKPSNGGTLASRLRNRDGGGKLNKKTLAIVGVVLLVLALVAVAVVVIGNGIRENATADSGYYASPSAVDDVGHPQEGAQPAPEAPESNLSADEKKSWAGNVLEGVIGAVDLVRPSFEEFLSHPLTMWLFYIALSPLLLLMVYRDRIQANEMQDILILNIGTLFMFLCIMLSEKMAEAYQGFSGSNENASLITVIGVVFFVYWLVSFIASYMGKSDYSVFAAAVFISGMALKWWLGGDNGVINIIANVVMLLGVGTLLLEIRRTAREADADLVMLKSLGGTVLMVVIFVLAFGLIFGVFESAIENQPILADPEAQIEASLKITSLAGIQLPLSIVVGLGSAIVAGLLYGMLVLKPASSRRSGYVDGGMPRRGGDISLDADSQALFVMILIMLFPWITLLPELIKILMRVLA